MTRTVSLTKTPGEPSAIEGSLDSSPDDNVDFQPVTVTRKRGWRWWVTLFVLGAIAISAGVLTYVFNAERDDVTASVSDESAVVKVASDGAVAILSYKPDTVDSDLDSAKRLITGDFLDYYSDFTAKVVAPASKEKKVTTTATVPAAGAVSVSESKAVVLVMVNQQTVTAEEPTPADSASSVRVEMRKQDGHWLISKFDPV